MIPLTLIVKGDTIKSMKTDIHPTYYPEAAVKCACGNKFTVGSTRPEIKVEICHKCHPFYTGEKKLIDTAGRVEKFRARRAKAAASNAADATRAPRKRIAKKK